MEGASTWRWWRAIVTWRTDETIPVGFGTIQVVNLKIQQRKRKAVVDTNDGRHILGQALRQPFRKAAPGPVFARAGWWLHFYRHRLTAPLVNPKSLQTGIRSFRAGVVDTDISLEGRMRHKLTFRNLLDRLLGRYLIAEPGHVASRVAILSQVHPPSQPPSGPFYSFSGSSSPADSICFTIRSKSLSNSRSCTIRYFSNSLSA